MTLKAKDAERAFRRLIEADGWQERFWSKVRKTADCWYWTAARTPFGYGKFFTVKIEGLGKFRTAHVIAYESVHGPVHLGLVLDHLCSNPACVRPSHLEPVTQKENVARTIVRGRHFSPNRGKTSCVNGHPLTGTNVQFDKQGFRHCRSCRNSQARASRHRRRGGIS